MTAPARPKPRSPNAENDQTVYMMALQRVEKALADLKTELGDVKETLGWTGFDEHGALIGVGIAGNVARLEQRVNRRFAIYDGVTKYAAGATAATILVGGVLWWVIKSRMEAIFQ
jgi:hypothetical protein